MNNNTSKEFRNEYAKNKNVAIHMHHWQERWYDKAMDRIAIPILREYYKSVGVTKSQF